MIQIVAKAVEAVAQTTFPGTTSEISAQKSALLETFNYLVEHSSLHASGKGLLVNNSPYNGSHGAKQIFLGKFPNKVSSS